jgi:hypothetical protein
MKRVIATLVCSALGSIQAPAQSTGPLRVHPENPRYFSDSSGRAILLTGSHTWANIVDIGPSDPPNAFDFGAYLAWLRGYGHNFVRGWTWEPTKWDTSKMKNPNWRNSSHTVSPHPWIRSGPGLALDGHPKFDLEKLNPDYLSRLKTRVNEAQEQGIFISIMLFEGFGVQFLADSWPNHPLNSANNVTGINGDTNGDGKGLEVHQLADPQVTRIQENYVHWVVKGLNEYDNVLYEISNETHPSSTAWQYHMINFIKECEQRLPKQHPVGMTYQNKRGSNETLFASPADWVSPNSEGGYRDDPPDTKGHKVVISDTDHLWGIGGDASWVWKSVTRGLNPIFMDPYDGRVLAKPFPPEYDATRKAMGQALEFTQRMNLARAIPQNALASTSYCLAEAGVSYLIFAPEAEDIVVDLSAHPGPFIAEWRSSDVSEVSDRLTIIGGAKRTLSVPFDDPAVLFITRANPVEK